MKVTCRYNCNVSSGFLNSRINIDDFNIIRENILLLDAEECLIPGIFNKTITSFKKITLSYDYKYIFRTNLSSFIRIDILLEKTNNILINA